MSADLTLVGIGEALWDLLPDGPQLGGAPANFAFHARALGARAALVSGVGDDEPGRRLIERLARGGIDTRCVALDPAHPTGSVSVDLDTDGVPRYVIHEDVAWDHIPWHAGLEALAASADAVCFGSLCRRAADSRRTIRRFVEATRPDTLRLCDINLRHAGVDRALVEELLGQADVLKLNDQELPVLTALFPGSLADLAARFDLRLIALTRGPHGSVLSTPGRVSDHPGCAVEVVDTVGAGDAFTAALALGLLRGDDLDAINEAANRRAAAVCARHGATPEIDG